MNVKVSEVFCYLGKVTLGHLVHSDCILVLLTLTPQTDSGMLIQNTANTIHFYTVPTIKNAIHIKLPYHAFNFFACYRNNVRIP